MKIDFKIGDIFFLSHYDGFYKYVGRDEDQRHEFRLIVGNPREKMKSLRIAFPVKHLTDKSYGERQGLVAMKKLSRGDKIAYMKRFWTWT